MKHNNVMNDRQVQINFWDTAGQEKYRSFTTTFYKDAHGVIVVFDITNRFSFDNLDIWLNEVQLSTSKETKILLIGNKIDLEEKRRVKTEEGNNYAKNNKLFYMETSAKLNANNCVNNAIEKIVGEIVNDAKVASINSNSRYSVLSSKARGTLIEFPTFNEKKKGCC